MRKFSSYRIKCEVVALPIKDKVGIKVGMKEIIIEISVIETKTGEISIGTMIFMYIYMIGQR